MAISINSFQLLSLNNLTLRKQASGRQEKGGEREIGLCFHDKRLSAAVCLFCVAHDVHGGQKGRDLNV